MAGSPELDRDAAIAIRRAGPSDVPRLAGVLARAFATDPMVVEPMGGGASLVERIEGMFALVDADFAREGWLWATADGQGVMALLPPGTVLRERELSAAIAPRLAPLFADGGERYEALWSWIDETVPAEPHWLLDQLAVEPASQGRGLGRALLRRAIEAAADDGVPLLLETAVERNVALYARHGFEVYADGEAPPQGPRIWFMRRDPGAGSSAGRFGPAGGILGS